MFYKKYEDGIVLSEIKTILHVRPTYGCSDCFEIKCFTGEKVYVIFVLDTCDREVIGVMGKASPILAVDVQSIIVESVERRFGQTSAPRMIQLLTDRGSIYRVKETKLLVACH